MITVIKLGGSLCRDRRILARLCKELNRLDNIIIIPGGGEFADKIREIDRKFSLNPAISHGLAILAMCQTGLLIRNFFNGEIFDCTKLLKDENLKPSWDVTSDSIAAYVAINTKAKRLILLKDVDGLFTKDPKKSKKAELILEPTARQLSRMKNSCLDPEFYNFVKNSNLEIWIINGKYLRRIRKIMNGEETIGTRVL